MKKESKLNLNAGDYAISHCDSDKTYNGLEVHKMLCDAYIAGNNDTLEDDDERIKNSLINLIKMSNEAGMLVNLSQLKRVAKPSEKQGEQNFEMKTAEESLDIGSNTYNKIVDECIFGEQKPEENKGNIVGISPNWSEEDERKLNGICMYIMCSGSPEGYTEWIDWFKSIKDRVLSQPKQEWSEEDEQHIDSLLKRLDSLCRNKFERTRFAISEDRDWLKSLRPQNRWKPSETDIMILEKVFNGKIDPKDFQATLFNVLEQLKKLKEEEV